ncbi:GNAT family N-acetyltransferase [Austwickia chelonae]|uniref:GNAT family N-acetyltransferase n=1 Tax=Austwickia chelonae TaxID=100225 RepID=UPI000E256166|nr:GNAT family N-acetyltransferase [Austwickia chelonae]
MSVPLPFPRRRATAEPTGLVASRSTVRQANPDDAEAVGAVQADLWVGAFTDVLPAEALALCTPESFAQAWRSSLSAPPSADHLLLIAAEDESIVGLAAVAPGDEPDLDATELLLFGVVERHRCRGHASRLMAAVAESVEQRGGDLLISWVLIGHEEMRAHLQGAGFVADGARRERVVDPEGRTVTEVRLVVSLRTGSPLR